jgi:hypothetical protein
MNAAACVAVEEDPSTIPNVDAEAGGAVIVGRTGSDPTPAITPYVLGPRYNGFEYGIGSVFNQGSIPFLNHGIDR